VGTSEQSFSHSYLACQFEVLTTCYIIVHLNLKVGGMHMLVMARCTCSCGRVLMMHIRMTRLPT
jgi:hypothetical protein